MWASFGANPVPRLTLLLCAAMAYSNSSSQFVWLSSMRWDSIWHSVRFNRSTMPGLCLDAAGESLYGPKHAEDFAADRGHELWISVTKESVRATPSRDEVVYQLGCATLCRLLVSQ